MQKRVGSWGGCFEMDRDGAHVDHTEQSTGEAPVPRHQRRSLCAEHRVGDGAASLAVFGPNAPGVFLAGFEGHFGGPFGLFLALRNRPTAFFFAGGAFDLEEIFGFAVGGGDVGGDELYGAGVGG